MPEPYVDIVLEREDINLRDQCQPNRKWRVTNKSRVFHLVGATAQGQILGSGGILFAETDFLVWSYSLAKS